MWTCVWISVYIIHPELSGIPPRVYPRITTSIPGIGFGSTATLTRMKCFLKKNEQWMTFTYMALGSRKPMLIRFAAYTSASSKNINWIWQNFIYVPIRKYFWARTFRPGTLFIPGQHCLLSKCTSISFLISHAILCYRVYIYIHNPVAHYESFFLYIAFPNWTACSSISLRNPALYNDNKGDVDGANSQ